MSHSTGPGLKISQIRKMSEKEKEGKAKRDAHMKMYHASVNAKPRRDGLCSRPGRWLAVLLSLVVRLQLLFVSLPRPPSSTTSNLHSFLALRWRPSSSRARGDMHCICSGLALNSVPPCSFW